MSARISGLGSTISGPKGRVGATLCLLLLAVSACGMGRTPPESQPAEVSAPKPKIKQKGENMADPVSEWKGQFSGISVGYVSVIKDVDEWKKLWTETFKKDPPPVDFEKNVAGCVFVGSKNTGGYGVEFLEVAAKEGVMVIQWKEKTPAAGGMVIQAFTQPWGIKLFPRAAGDITIDQPAKH